MTKDKIFEDIQNIVSANPVVIIGSGASVSYGIPGMGGLAESLKDFFQPQSSEIIRTYKNRDSVDAINAFLKKLEEGFGLEEALLSIKVPEEAEHAIIYCVWKIISDADKKVYTRFTNGEEIDLKSLFEYMIYGNQDKIINVISTNYDKIAEYAASQTSAYINTGFTIGMKGYLKENVIELPRKVEQDYIGFINILKVHGSLDWFKDNKGVVCYPNIDKIPDGYIPCIITPGTNKYERTQQEPHRQLLSSIDKIFSKASGYLCIGYGFNDQHVHPILLKNAQKYRTKILIVTKDITPSIQQNVIEKDYNFIIISSNGKEGTKITTLNDSIEIPNKIYWTIKGFEEIYK